MDVGIDIESVERFKLKKNDNFVENNFSKTEIKYAFSCQTPEIRLAGFFCVKEAYTKIEKRLEFNRLSVEHEKNGKPYLTKDGKKTKIKISISHTQKLATAIAIKE